MVRYPPLVLNSTQTHLCDTPFCNVSRDNCAIPTKTSTKEICDTIATSIARYDKYHCWASKLKIMTLAAPYCAIPRDYLSDTPLLRAIGFVVSQHDQLGAIPPPPHKRGISAILERYHIKQGKWVLYPLLRYYLEKVLRDWGGGGVYLALGR